LLLARLLHERLLHERLLLTRLLLTRLLHERLLLARLLLARLLHERLLLTRLLLTRLLHERLLLTCALLGCVLLSRLLLACALLARLLPRTLLEHTLLLSPLEALFAAEDRAPLLLAPPQVVLDVALVEGEHVPPLRLVQHVPCLARQLLGSRIVFPSGNRVPLQEVPKPTVELVCVCLLLLSITSRCSYAFGCDLLPLEGVLLPLTLLLQPLELLLISLKLLLLQLELVLLLLACTLLDLFTRTLLKRLKLGRLLFTHTLPKCLLLRPCRCTLICYSLQPAL
jgi:hypothetical protein